MRCDGPQRRPTIFSKPGPVAQCVYGVHHHQRIQHTLQLFPVTHATFVPSPARPNLPRRSALTARLSCLHVLLQSQQHLRAQRAARTFPAVRAAPVASDHRTDPFSRPTARHPRLLYAAPGDPPTALCALYSMRSDTLHTQLLLQQHLRCAQESRSQIPRREGTRRTPTHRKRAR
ncbi:hypothetical protein K438DRAFT_1980756 [Mycena galopus ATCC 62051]|nr:hypothetical protein K438DRAFT_1980756 [Mycena galopus ATCC 62051]